MTTKKFKIIHVACTVLLLCSTGLKGYGCFTLLMVVDGTDYRFVLSAKTYLDVFYSELVLF